MNKYHFSTVFECPVDGAQIAYEIALNSRKTVYVEEVIELLNGIVAPIIQEDLSDLLKWNFKDADVYVVAYHSGVKVETWR